MKKKTITLAVLLSAAVLLCVCAALALSNNSAEGTVSEAETVSAFKLTGDIKSIKYENAGQAPVELMLSGEEWKLASNEAFPLSQSAPSSMLNYCKEVLATRYVGEAESLEEYGLDEPVLKITAETENETAQYLIGDKNSHTGDYYFAVSGSKSVYTVSYSFVSAFASTAEQMAQIEQPPSFAVSEADSVKITQNGSTNILTAENTEGKSSEAESTSGSAAAESVSGSDLQASAQRKYFINANGSTQEMQADKAESLLYSLNSLSFSSCAAFMPESLEAYGLESPKAEITLSYTKAASESETKSAQQSYTLLIGGTAPQGGQYVMLSGTQMVCIADEAAVDAILQSLAVSQ